MMGFDLKNDAIVTSGPTRNWKQKKLTTTAVITNDMLNGVKFETPTQAGLPPMLVNNYTPHSVRAWEPPGNLLANGAPCCAALWVGISILSRFAKKPA